MLSCQLNCLPYRDRHCIPNWMMQNRCLVGRCCLPAHGIFPAITDSLAGSSNCLSDTAVPCYQDGNSSFQPSRPNKSVRVHCYGDSTSRFPLPYFLPPSCRQKATSDGSGSACITLLDEGCGIARVIGANKALTNERALQRLTSHCLRTSAQAPFGSHASM